MFLKCNRRKKDGKEHRYWSIVESRRCAGGRVEQRPELNLGDGAEMASPEVSPRGEAQPKQINDSQREAWIRLIEVFDEDAGRKGKLTLFSSDREMGREARALARGHRVGARGGSARGRPPDRSGQRVAAAPALYAHSARGDPLGEDDALAAKDTLYRCLDKLVEHKQALFAHLCERWRDLFGVKFEALPYDLTSTCFESPPPEDPADKRKFGYSRDKRSDCVQVVIALIVTPEGFALSYEVLPGNTADKTTLRSFLDKIEAAYGQAERVWVMDRCRAAGRRDRPLRLIQKGGKTDCTRRRGTQGLGRIPR
jgi:hypothetical protein